MAVAKADEKKGDLVVVPEKKKKKKKIQIFGGLEKRFNDWVAKQSSPVQSAVNFIVDASNKVTYDAIVTNFIVYNTHLLLHSIFVPRPPPSSSQFLYRFGEYRPLVESLLVADANYKKRYYQFGAASVANAGIIFVMNKLRSGGGAKKKDLHTSMVAGFGYGVTLSLVSGMRAPAGVISVGFVFALFSGGAFKLKLDEKIFISEEKLPWNSKQKGSKK